MSTTMSVRIPAGKLGTVRVDRTVDIYPTAIIHNEIISNATTFIPKLKIQCHSSEISTAFIVTNPPEQCKYVSIRRANNQDDFNDDDDDDDNMYKQDLMYVMKQYEEEISHIREKYDLIIQSLNLRLYISNNHINNLIEEMTTNNKL